MRRTCSTCAFYIKNTRTCLYLGVPVLDPEDPPCLKAKRVKEAFHRIVQPPKVPSPAKAIVVVAIGLVCLLLFMASQVHVTLAGGGWRVIFAKDPSGLLVFAALVVGMLLGFEALAVSIVFDRINDALYQLARDIAELRALAEHASERTAKMEEDLSRLRAKVLQLEQR